MHANPATNPGCRFTHSNMQTGSIHNGTRAPRRYRHSSPKKTANRTVVNNSDRAFVRYTIEGTASTASSAVAVLRSHSNAAVVPTVAAHAISDSPANPAAAKTRYSTTWPSQG